MIRSIRGMIKKARHSVTFFCSYFQSSDKACPTQIIFFNCLCSSDGPTGTSRG